MKDTFKVSCRPTDTTVEAKPTDDPSIVECPNCGKVPVFAVESRETDHVIKEKSTMMHLGDDFSRQSPEPQNDLGPAGQWPKPQTHPDVTLRNTNAGWDKAAQDSTNETMLEKGLIQPEDL